MIRMNVHCLPVWYRLWIWTLAAVLLWIPANTHAAFFYKDYEVRDFRGTDVLCDYYVVLENDYVIKILKQRGDIAHENFPKFLEIFKQINPNIGDIDRIYPNQRILIPLRILAPGTFEGQESGRVNMPVITITDLPRVLKHHSDVYEVRYGDWVSRLIARRFGEPGSQSYEKGIELFRKLNPDIKELDKIQAGTEIRLPDPAIRNQPWYEDLFESPDTQEQQESSPEDLSAYPGPGATDVLGGTEEKTETEETEDEKNEKSVLPPPVQWFKDLSVFARAAEIVDAQIYDKGLYFFPRKRGRDIRLDLSRTPVLELGNGKKILFTRRQGLPPSDQMVVQDYWGDLEVVFVSGEPQLSSLIERLINEIDPNGYKNRVSIEDKGVLIAVRGRFIYNSSQEDSRICLNIVSEPDMRTPPSVCDYLARHDVQLREWVDKEDMSGWVLREPRKNPPERQVPVADPGRPALLVRAIAEMLGYQYHENVEISFPHSGFQVKASTDMLSAGQQAEIILDYGSLQGGAVEAIEKSGFKVLQIESFRDVEKMLETLAEDLPVSYEKEPMFWTAERPRIHNTSVQIPGWLVYPAESSSRGGLLLTRTNLADALIDYLHEDAGVKVIQLRR
ncbi:MAG: hypothetical protein ACOC03_02230 [Desulfosalsimonas sp.]